MSPSERSEGACKMSLEELQRGVGRCTHPFDEPAALGLRAANLGDDADTTGAVYGQLKVPPDWTVWIHATCNRASQAGRSCSR